MTAQVKPVEHLDLRPEQRSRPVAWWRRAIAFILKTLIPLAILAVAAKVVRSEERRVGKECRSRWSPYH